MLVIPVVLDNQQLFLVLREVEDWQGVVVVLVMQALRDHLVVMAQQVQEATQEIMVVKGMTDTMVLEDMVEEQVIQELKAMMV